MSRYRADQFLTYSKFLERCERSVSGIGTNEIRASHWKDLEARWEYHRKTIEVIKCNGVGGRILEIGTMGVSVFERSDTMDYDLRWPANFTCTYNHDVRLLPWPIEDKAYEWVVALRVFHHLYPFQRMCFQEAQRVARNIVIVVPEQVFRFKSAITRPVRQLRTVYGCTDHGVTENDFVRWNNGTPPRYSEKLSTHGKIYFWDEPSFRANACGGQPSVTEKFVGKWVLSHRFPKHPARNTVSL